MFGDYITIGQAVIVCVFSLVVVFAVLLVISYLIDLTALLTRRMGGRRSKPAAAPAETAGPGADTDAAVLAAAAVAACLGVAPDRIVVRSIRRITDGQTPWSQAARSGSLQSTER